MMLSNTAIPKYYGDFRARVLSREIPVCEEMSMEMNRIDYLIENPNIYYDVSKVDGWIAFCEDEMCLTNGDKFTMLDSFKLWGEQVFGWYYFEDRKVPTSEGGYVIKKELRRLINKQYIITSRGSAKSLYDTFIQSYGEVIDTETTDGIHTAPTMRQADEVIAPFRTAITKAQGPLFKFLTEGSINNTTGSIDKRPKLYSSKDGIKYTISNSIVEVRPMSIDRLQGLRCKYATVDEWLSGVIREDPVGAIEQGASKLDDYLIVATSSEGCVRNGAGDDVKMELSSILHGDYVDLHTSIFWYKLDDIEEVGKPEMWVKASPNIGITVKYETYQRDVERAEKVPAARNDILAKRFGLPMEGFTFFFTYEETLVHTVQNYFDMPCALGADLSKGDDFCSFTFEFPLRLGFGVKSRSYISNDTYTKLSPSRRSLYDKFIQEESLVVMEGITLDMMAVYDDLDEFIYSRNYDVRAFGYDPYNAKAFVDRWELENGPFGVIKVAQGAKTESVPLGEIKKHAENRTLYFDEASMQFSMGNCMVEVDTNGNRKLYKKNREDKIDPVSALVDAHVAYTAFVDMFE